MRLRATDPAADRATVFLNGEPTLRCVEVDTDEGWADCIVLDANGHFVVEGDGPKVERVFGDVRVELRDA